MRVFMTDLWLGSGTRCYASDSIWHMDFGDLAKHAFPQLPVGQLDDYDPISGPQPASSITATSAKVLTSSKIVSSCCVNLT